jgi:hypothetical protein
MNPKNIFVLLLSVQLLNAISMSTEEDFKQVVPNFDPKKLAPVADLVTMVPDYYDEGEGPEDEDYSDDIVDTEKPKESEDKDKNSEMDKKITEEVVDELYRKNTPAENVEMAVGGLSGIITKLIKGPNKKELPKNASAERVYIYMSNMFAEEIEKTVKSILPKVYDYTYTINDLLSQECFNSLAQFGNRARKGEPWALECKSVIIKIVL